MKRTFLVLTTILGATVQAEAHPGVGGCKGVVMGDVTYATDCSVQLNANSVTSVEIADFVDGEVLNLSGVIPDATADDGLILPGNPINCNGATHEAQVCWNRASDMLYIGTGTAAKLFAPGDVENVGDCSGPDCFTGSGTGSLFRFGSTANVAAEGNLRFDVSGRFCWKFGTVPDEPCIAFTSPGQVHFDHAFLYMGASFPQVILDDEDIANDGGSPEGDGTPEASVYADAQGEDAGRLQFLVESSAPNVSPGALSFLSIFTDSGGATTMSVAGKEAQGATAPSANAIVVTEAGPIMEPKGTAEIRGTAAVETQAVGFRLIDALDGALPWCMAKSNVCVNADGDGDPCEPLETSPTSFLCSSAEAPTLGMVALDGAVTIRKITCAFARHPTTGAWDSGDSVTICLKEVGASASGNCLANTTFPAFTNASTNGIVSQLTPNQITSLSADYGLAIGFPSDAVDSGGADEFNLLCTVIY